MKQLSLWEIYILFVKIGVQMLGGGYVILPLLNKYLVHAEKILKEEEVIDYFALSQCIPGIIAINISAFSGYKMRGIWGALFAVLGVITTPFAAILVFAHILLNLTKNVWVQDAFYGIKISVIILILLTIKEMWGKSINSEFTYCLFSILFILMAVSKIPPEIIVILAGILALIYTKIKEKTNA